MAVATAFAAINMNNWQFHELNQLIIAPDQVTAYEAGNTRTTYYQGSGFGGDETNGVTSGTVTGIEHNLGDTVQYRITGLSHSAATLSDHLETQSSAFLPFLFSGADILTGSASADQLNGYNGNDKINGGLGADRINGGAGNDTITWGNGDIVNGAAGTDVLKLSIDLNLVSLANTKIKNIETINMVGGGQNTLTIGTSDVLALSSSTDTIKITGDDNDIVNIDVPSLGTPTPQGAFMRYEFGLAILLIESDVNVV
jgi:Ca2+-binding RTX toxin-like protein